MLPAYSWQAVLTQWEFAPVVTVGVAVAAALYLWGVVRVARRHPTRPWPIFRTLMFMGGLAIVVIAIESGIGAYDDVLAWDHMIQHLLLLMVAPALMVVSQPFTLLLHASRNPVHTWAKRAMRSKVVSFLTWPPFTLVLYVATVAGTHLTSLAQLILTNQLVHETEHVVYLVVGYLFFLPLLGREPIRWRLGYMVRFVILVITMPVDTFTGLILMYSNTPQSIGPTPPGSPGPIVDVHDAGAVMWIGGDAIMLVMMMFAVAMWARDDKSGSLGLGWLENIRRTNMEERMVEVGQGAGAAAVGVSSRKGGTADDEEHLAAYNAYLARLHGSGTNQDQPS